jgi:hypothetical protein
MINQFPHFLGELTLSLLQPQQVFPQTHLVTIDLILMEPDATLWLLCVVILEIEAEGFVACAGGAHDKGAFGNCQHKSAAGKRGNVRNPVLHIIRRRRCRAQKWCTHECRDEDIAEGVKVSPNSACVSCDAAAVLHDDRTP